MKITRSHRRLLALTTFASLTALAAAGCSHGVDNVPVIGAISHAGVPSATIHNEYSVPINVTLWTSERRPTYNDSWGDMVGRTERIEVGKKGKFFLREYDKAADPILRIQIQTRGPSYDPVQTYWFELISGPSFTARVTGADGDLSMASKKARIDPIPASRVLKTPETDADKATADAERSSESH